MVRQRTGRVYASKRGGLKGTMVWFWSVHRESEIQSNPSLHLYGRIGNDTKRNTEKCEIKDMVELPIKKFIWLLSKKFVRILSIV